MTPALPRRRLLVFACGSGLAMVVAPPIARATPAEVAAAIRRVAGEAPVRPGRVKLELPLLVENGNAVGMTVSVDAPMEGPERVRSLHVFAEGNPLPEVAHYRFGPRAGRARISTRIRLADSQTVTAVAVLEDGSCWSDSVELVVTLAACLD